MIYNLIQITFAYNFSHWAQLTQRPSPIQPSALQQTWHFQPCWPQPDQSKLLGQFHRWPFLSFKAKNRQLFTCCCYSSHWLTNQKQVRWAQDMLLHILQIWDSCLISCLMRLPIFSQSYQNLAVRYVSHPCLISSMRYDRLQNFQLVAKLNERLR